VGHEYHEIRAARAVTDSVTVTQSVTVIAPRPLARKAAKEIVPPRGGRL
jgi:hypothetical protein